MPSGATPCSFCLSMAAVGVSKSFEAMAAGKTKKREFHDSCRCIFVPSFLDANGKAIGIDLAGYNPTAIQNALTEARRALGFSISGELTDAQMDLLTKELEGR